MSSTRYSCQVFVNLEFSPPIFFLNPQVSNLMKICPVGAKSFHVGGETEWTNLSVSSRSFTNAPCNMMQKYYHFYYTHEIGVYATSIHTL